MWSKFTQALKPRQSQDDEPPSSFPVEVLSKVFEQHPNLSVFHNQSDNQFLNTNTSPPGSPTKSSRRGMFKRISKMPPRDDDSIRAPSPMSMRLPLSMPKKVRSPLNFNENTSQLSLPPSSITDINQQSQYSQNHTESNDVFNQDPPRKSGETLRRPSLDMLRMNTSRRSDDSLRINGQSRSSGGDPVPSPLTPNIDFKFSSVRSILRDPKTPGTGQNVRFFSRDAYKVISPEQSMDLESIANAQDSQEPLSFLDRLNKSSPENGSNSAVVPRSASVTKSSRPTVAEVFSPLIEPQTSNNSSDSMSLTNAIPPPDFTNIFDVSQQIDLPDFPPGLDFEINAPRLDNSIELMSSAVEGDDHSKDMDSRQYPGQMTSTPYKPKETNKGKGKERAHEDDESNEKLLPAPPIDETIFHAKEKVPRFPAPLHDRSQSFSFGQTVFYSMANSADADKTGSELSAAYPSSELKANPTLSSAISSPPSSGKNRNRAMSDTAFHAMLRSPSRPPEADINDELSSDVIVYGGGEPDPFSANANTYYTPQTMIPITPPQGPPKHTRKTSKEESIIFSLQTQLALQTELCSQYETDLRARDELVEILGKKLADVEKEEAKRKGVLRAWKKKVQELEKACRMLEEEVDDSRQMSMERSVMDEASGEALRMLHRQIASLERERGDWVRKERILQEEVETLESLVKERSEDVIGLKEMLWSRDESERELKEGIREAKEQIEMLGNVSVGIVDEEELRKLVMEKEQKGEEKNGYRAAELGWQQEREELVAELESLQASGSALEEQLENVKATLKTKEEEYSVLKSELEAQWGHTERGSQRIEELAKEKAELEKERDALRQEVEELESRMSNMEVEWNESENKRTELENELQEFWNIKDALEKERDELDQQLRDEQQHTEALTVSLQEREDHVEELQQEHQFTIENVARLEENIRGRDAEVAEYTQRMMEREAEAEQLREEMSDLRREHSHMAGGQQRAVQDAAEQEKQARAQMEELIRQNAQAEVEVKSSRDRLNAIKDEVERLRRQVHELQQESADKEVKIVQITKQRAQDKEDLAGLNIALDSKQQELELLKRRQNVRGTAGSTPAQPSKVAHRRDSSIFSSTPTISRPPSVLSDMSAEGGMKRKVSAEGPSSSSVKATALGKSTRINGTAASATKVSSRIEGSMGPPPMKPRSSMMGTPTPTARLSSFSKPSSSTKPIQTPTSTPVPHRRVSSATLKSSKSTINVSPVPSLMELDEKENIDVTKTSKRRSMIPTPS